MDNDFDVKLTEVFAWFDSLGGRYLDVAKHDIYVKLFYDEEVNFLNGTNVAVRTKQRCPICKERFKIQPNKLYKCPKHRTYPTRYCVSYGIKTITKDNLGRPLDSLQKAMKIAKEIVLNRCNRKPVVYFIRERGNGNIKIGFSNGVYTRFYMLQQATATNLELLGYVSGDTNLESDLHNKFHKYHLRGEWYKEHPDIINWIKEHSEAAGRPASGKTDRLQ